MRAKYLFRLFESNGTFESAMLFSIVCRSTFAINQITHNYISGVIKEHFLYLA